MHDQANESGEQRLLVQEGPDLLAACFLARFTERGIGHKDELSQACIEATNTRSREEVSKVNKEAQKR